MKPLARSTPHVVAAIVVAIVMVAIGFLPLFGGPGYEHTLASGLIVPSAAAIATAIELSALRASPVACVARGAIAGLWLAAIAFATALLHGARVGICDLRGGAFDFVLGAGIGSILGGVWGALVAEIARRRRRRRLACVLLSIAAPLGGVVVSVARFYTSPMIFAFDPFVGYFSGTLYDTVIDAGGALLSYRAASLCTIAGALLVASALARRADGRIEGPVRGDAGAYARAVLGGVALTVTVVTTMLGARLGHWQTPTTIARELGGARSGPRCDVVFPDSLRPDEAALLLKDCEEEIASVEQYLGVRGPDRITAFFFRDAAEKKRLMGAADTYIAKPWRREVYLQVAPYPHPVLGHEIAHVVAGSFGRGPFRIAGAAGGLWPNPGLIEGIAVAASPDDDELTDAQWARAMLDLKILPKMSDVFSFGFLGANSSKSYTLAGAFVRFVIDRWGVATARRWFGGEDITVLTSMPWGALDEAFRVELAKYKLSPDALAFAKAKFDRPSVFGRTCPHVIDALKREASKCESNKQIVKATGLYESALARDPHDFGARTQLGAMLVRFGDADRGRTELRAVADDDKAPMTSRERARDALADDELLRAEFEAAARDYAALAARAVDEDVGRTLEVKALAATNLPARRAVQALLIGAPGRSPDAFAGALWLGVWSNQGADPLADYLVGRNLMQHGWHAEAASFFDRALASPAPTPRIGRELLRQRAIAACALGDAVQVGRVRALVRSADGAPAGPFADGYGGRLEWVERMLARCAR